MSAAASSRFDSARTAGATSSRSAARTKAGRGRRRRPSCATCSPTSSAASGRPASTDRRRAPKSPTFHEFASAWLEARRGELREATIADYTWQLCNHLLPFFHAHRLPQISVAEVDRYREFKVRERVLSAESINKTITRLGQILAVAEERDLIIRNPVRVNTRNRKLKAKRKRPVYLDSAEQIVALIDAAAQLDAKPEARTAGRRALIATLVFAGLRIGEARPCAGTTSTSPPAAHLRA